MTTFLRQQTSKKPFAQAISSCLACGRASASRSSQRTSDPASRQRTLAAPPPVTLKRRGHDFHQLRIDAPAPIQPQATLAVSAPGDACEQEADRIADQVVRESGPHSSIGSRGSAHATALTQATTSVQAMHLAGQGIKRAAAPMIHAALRSPGQPLDATTRTGMEARFGHDFSHVRVHTGRQAAQAARALQAHAFTFGSDIFFKPGRFAPHTQDGARLLAHELTHTLQQRASGPAIQRDPDEAAAPAADPLCETFDFAATSATVTSQTETYQATKATENRLPLIRTLKLIRRCATVEQQAQIKADLTAALGAEETAKVWGEAGTAFGGYTGIFPEYAPDIRGHLAKLGTSETRSFGSFELSAQGKTHRSRARKVAQQEVADLARTDIVYFRGHQFAQYRAPGVFSNGNETMGFDLRYIEQAGGFPNVKLMISTSCATLCKEAFEVFHGLFPNAVILGYRKSAPREGEKVRNIFQSKIKALSRPLLLDQAVDISAIIAAWKATIENVHAGDTDQLPGYYENGTIHYWDGSAWQTISPEDEANVCKRKRDFRDQYPAPLPAATP